MSSVATLWGEDSSLLFSTPRRLSRPSSARRRSSAGGNERSQPEESSRPLPPTADYSCSLLRGAQTLSDVGKRLCAECSILPVLKLNLWFNTPLRLVFVVGVFLCVCVCLHCSVKVCPQLAGDVWPTPAWLIFNVADLGGSIYTAFNYSGQFKLTVLSRRLFFLPSPPLRDSHSFLVFDSSNRFHQSSIIASLEFS